MGDLDFVSGLEGRLMEVVVGCYVKSFEYAHSKSSLNLESRGLTTCLVMSLACAVMAFLIVLTWREHKL